jgi:polysaccharide deacetylase family protein (PEP-CTERM system associated)
MNAAIAAASQVHRSCIAAHYTAASSALRRMDEIAERLRTERSFAAGSQPALTGRVVRADPVTIGPMRGETNILTVDVEDWFHILESDEAPDRERWDSLPSRVEQNTDRLLELFASAGARATFFTVGWVAWRYPELVKRIHSAGHELASHTFWHEVVRRHDRESFAADLAASKSVLEDLTGEPVSGYRAAGNSITPSDAWAFDVILEQGYSYDASLCPAISSHGGFPSPYRGPHLLRSDAGTLVEIPSATVGIGARRVPYAGGGYLRLFPYSVLRSAIDLDNGLGRPTNLYVHPREIDVDQPRMDLPRLRRFKYYVGLASTQRKLEKLLARYRFVGCRDWIRERRPALLGQVFDVRELARDAAPHPDPALVPPRPPVSAPA